MGRATLVAALALLVLAGCAAPTVDSGAGEPAGPSVAAVGNATPEGVNETRTFLRVARLLDTNVSTPERVRYVRPNASAGPNVTVPRAWRALGVEREATDRGPRLNAQVNGLGMITVVRPANASDRAVERVLAHEFVHYVQVRERVRSRLAANATSVDRRSFAVPAIVEGAAVVVTDAYVRRHLGGPPNHQLYVDLAVRLPDGGVGAFLNLHYRAGWRYVDAVGGPDAAYADPPRTSEAVLHRLELGEEPPAPLAVNATGSWRTSVAPRFGEAFLRTALAGALDDGAARRAAAGWGNDRVVTVDAPNDTAHAWVLRFDSAGETDEFVGSVDSYVAERARSEGAARLARADDRTAVLLVGKGSERVDVSGGRTVTLRTP